MLQKIAFAVRGDIVARRLRHPGQDVDDLDARTASMASDLAWSSAGWCAADASMSTRMLVKTAIGPSQSSLSVTSRSSRLVPCRSDATGAPRVSRRQFAHHLGADSASALTVVPSRSIIEGSPSRRELKPRRLRLLVRVEDHPRIIAASHASLERPLTPRTHRRRLNQVELPLREVVRTRRSRTV
jgi:hypothetical protein